MVSSIWVTVTSLVGVVVGGALSMFSQRFAERSAARRHAATILEGRRGERLAHLVAFIEIAQQAERLATSVHQHNAAGDIVVERTEATLDELWVRLRAVQLVCPSEVGDAARTLASNVYGGPTGSGSSVRRGLSPPKQRNLIALARDDLERVSPG